MQRKTRDVQLKAGDATLPGTLTIPGDIHGLVIFAHGSGSSRHSSRNIAVANDLVDGGFATLLFDLLTQHEEADRRNVFDISLLGRRMIEAVTWVTQRDEFQHVPIGLFGASTGAAAALLAAAAMPGQITAVVSRGGRPDLAGEALSQVDAPTLFIVGSLDTEVLELNRTAMGQLTCLHELATVQGATHLFEESGALKQVSLLAGQWFQRHFSKTAATRSSS